MQSAVIVVVLIVAVVAAIAYASLSTPSKQPVTIKFAMCQGQDTDYVKSLIPKFEQENPGVKVELESMVYYSVREKEVMELSAGTGAYDGIMVDFPWVVEYAKAGWMLSLDEIIKDPKLTPPDFDPGDFHPRIWELNKVDGKTWTIPFVTGVRVMAYRADIYQKEGLKVPETWDEYYQNAKVINEKYAPDIYGTMIMGARGDHLNHEWPVFLWSFGGDIFDQSWKPTLNETKAIESLEYMKSLLQFSPPGALTYGWYEAITAGMDGLPAQMIFYSHHCSLLEDPSTSKVVGKYSFAKPPKGTEEASLLAGWGLGIPKSSKHQDEAWKFISYVTSKEGAKSFTLAGGAGYARVSVLNDPEVSNKWRFIKAVLDTMPYCHTHPRIAEWPQVADMTALELSNALSGKKTCEMALSDAAAYIELFMARAGYYK